MWSVNTCSMWLAEPFSVEGFTALPVALSLCHVSLFTRFWCLPISYWQTLSLLWAIYEAVPSIPAALPKVMCKMHQVMFSCSTNPSDIPINHNILKLYTWCNYRINSPQVNSSEQINWTVKLYSDYREILFMQFKLIYQFIFATKVLLSLGKCTLAGFASSGNALVLCTLSKKEEAGWNQVKNELPSTAMLQC